MSWLKKLFGGAASLESVQRLVAQKRFAEARLEAERLAEQPLEEAQTAQLHELRQQAGDGLARLNLAEAQALQRSGDAQQATEHFQLARDQACSEELRMEIEVAAETAAVPEVLAPQATATTAASCSGCSSPSSPSTAQNSSTGSFNQAGHLELILTSYPAEMRPRYLQKSTRFQQAFLLSHGGDDAAALPRWEEVEEEERDELFWFEYGSALARQDNRQASIGALDKALQLNPEFLLATEALIPQLMADERSERAEKLLKGLLKDGRDPGFCHAQLAALYAQRKRPDTALDHVRKGLQGGARDPGFLALAAGLLERAGALDEAEQVLQRFPSSGGCGGGLSLPLAEFYLRQGRELARVLDAFNAACRQEPDNPRWPLRAAQTYLARGWQKEGLELLKKVVSDPRLDQRLQQEAEQQLAIKQGH